MNHIFYYSILLYFSPSLALVNNFSFKSYTHILTIKTLYKWQKIDRLSLSYLSYCNRKKPRGRKIVCFLIWKIFNVRLELVRDFHGIYGTLATSNNGGHNRKCIILKPRRISEVLRMKNAFSNRLFVRFLVF